MGPIGRVRTVGAQILHHASAIDEVPLPPPGSDPHPRSSLVMGARAPQALVDALESVVGISTGSGWVAAENRIVTAAHVVDDESKIFVTTKQGRIFEGRVLLADSEKDVAVLGFSGVKLPPPLKMHDHVEADTIAAATRFLDLEPPRVAVGPVRAVSRVPAGDQERIGFTGTLGPGSSGGPIVNSAGEVISTTVAGNYARTQQDGLTNAVVQEALKAVSSRKVGRTREL